MQVPLAQSDRLDDHWSECVSCEALKEALETVKAAQDKVAAASEQELRVLRKRMQKLEAENFRFRDERRAREADIRRADERNLREAALERSRHDTDMPDAEVEDIPRPTPQEENLGQALNAQVAKGLKVPDAPIAPRRNLDQALNAQVAKGVTVPDAPIAPRRNLDQALNAQVAKGVTVPDAPIAPRRNLDQALNAQVAGGLEVPEAAIEAEAIAPIAPRRNLDQALNAQVAGGLDVPGAPGAEEAAHEAHAGPSDSTMRYEVDEDAIDWDDDSISGSPPRTPLE